MRNLCAVYQERKYPICFSLRRVGFFQGAVAFDYRAQVDAGVGVRHMGQGFRRWPKSEQSSYFVQTKCQA